MQFLFPTKQFLCLLKRYINQNKDLLNALDYFLMKIIYGPPTVCHINNSLGYQLDQNLHLKPNDIPGWEQILRSGHKTDSGNQSTGGGSARSDEDREEENDEQTEYSKLKSDETADIQFQFNIEIESEKVATEGAVTASFKIFNENNRVTPNTMEISTEDGNTVFGQSIEIRPENYSLIYPDTEKSVVNLTVKANFDVAPDETDNTYSIVFDIVDEHENSDNHHSHRHYSHGHHSSDHHTHHENTLEYYKSIKTGTTHQREHITIEEIPLQRENSMVKRTGARLLSRMFSFLKTFFIS